MSLSDDLIANIVFDELAIGQQARLSRTLTVADIQAFALVSGDVNPSHVDPEYARSSKAHGVVGHGMWAGALISSLLGTEFPGPGTEYLSQALRFLHPVRVGDTLTVTLTVVGKDAANHSATMDCSVTNQHGERVASGQACVRVPTQKISRPRASLPTLHLFDPAARLSSWVDAVSPRLIADGPLPCAVVHPCDEGALRGALDAAERGLIAPLLIGPEGRIRAVAEAAGLSLAGATLLPTAHSHAAAAQAVALAAERRVAMLMKGSLHTDELMHAVLAEPRLRTGRRVSHVFRFEVPTYPKPLLITDAAINVAPDLAQKADIIRNAVELAHALDVPCPRVAILSAVETVSPGIASTLDAAALCKMADRGQIVGALLDGPLAFDNAISAAAAEIKGIRSPVAGQADILVVPDLEAGNMLAKQLEYLAGAASCGLVLGTQVPIALTSRADSATSRMASTVLASLHARHRQRAAATVRG